jgi:hypothetical protein
MNKFKVKEAKQIPSERTKVHGVITNLWWEDLTIAWMSVLHQIIHIFNMFPDPYQNSTFLFFTNGEARSQIPME